MASYVNEIWEDKLAQWLTQLRGICYNVLHLLTGDLEVLNILSK